MMEDKIKLYQGDCLEIMKQIPDKSVDFILCDFPYGTTQNKWDSIISLSPNCGGIITESLRDRWC
jgi:DNA modification methylase